MGVGSGEGGAGSEGGVITGGLVSLSGWVGAVCAAGLGFATGFGGAACAAGLGFTTGFGGAASASCCGLIGFSGVGVLTGAGFGFGVSGSSTIITSMGSSAISRCLFQSGLMLKTSTTCSTAEPTRLNARNFLRACCSFSRCSIQKLELLMLYNPYPEIGNKQSCHKSTHPGAVANDCHSRH